MNDNQWNGVQCGELMAMCVGNEAIQLAKNENEMMNENDE